MRRLVTISFMAVLLLASTARHADEDFSKRCLPAMRSHEARQAGPTPSVKEAYVQIIGSAASTYNLPASLIAAIIKAESGFNPKAISNRGAVGLMQLGFSTRKAMNVTNPFDPVQNILAGAKYLRHLLDRFKGDLPMAIAAYNAGPDAVERHGGIPPYSQTRQYVPKVMDYYSQYESGVAID